MPRRAARPKKLLPAGRPAGDGRTLADALAASLREAIENGTVGIGELLPPERELARRHKLGRVTVRTALGVLVSLGLIESRPGAGHVVVRDEALVSDMRPVGLIYRDLHAFGSGTSKSVPAIESELAAHGRALLVGSSGLTAKGENDCIKRFRSAGAGALVVAPATQGARSSELEAWIRRGGAVVLEGHPGDWLLPGDLADRADRVDIDNRGGIRQALEYLQGLGHRRLGFLTFGPGEGSERLAAFREVSAELGLEVRAGWVLSGADADAGDARGALRKLRAAGSMPTALVCADDDTALEFIDAAREAGLDCPADISVVGFGSESARGPAALSELTTIDYSREELAREILRLLDAQPGARGQRGEHVKLPTRLLLRSSCAPPRPAGAAKQKNPQ
jgi:DNA-binding LacI/PurR family transcriptional regulator